MHEFILEDRYNIICNNISLTCLVWHNSDNNLMLTAFESGNNYVIGEPTIVAKCHHIPETGYEYGL